MARTAAKAQKPATEPPLGRKDWIDAAIVMLAEDNVEALRVDTLAEKLGVTKGSFYWHFKGRDDLLFAVLDEWRLRMTSEIQSLILDRSGTPWERLERLLRIATSSRPDVPGGPFEMTLRDWARRNPKVAAVVRDVNAERVRFLQQLYREAGLEGRDVEDYAELHMAFVIGTRITVDPADRDEINRRRRIGIALILPRERAVRKS
ncbi:TetR/AcrR family transcriptional regulator [Pseudorhodoplanes sp.]|uniref:TetR/AcrR family transcriptional regulator n=1 Tax=Pseudorhodoplanes sp. TaxID=1934341 RepID=UPI00391A7353